MQSVKKHSAPSSTAFAIKELPIGDTSAPVEDDIMPDSPANALATCEIHNVEVFRSGTHNDVTYDNASLDEIVKNFNSGVAEPYVKIGHDEVQPLWDEFALGWVSGLKRVGDSLYANFKQVPRKIAMLMKSGALKKKSVEILDKYKSNGAVYDNVLRAVAFFGGNGAPAVSDLDDFIKLYKAGSDTTRIIKKGVNRMIEIEKEEYEKLLSFKANVETTEQTLTKLKADHVALETEKAELVEKFKKLEEEKMSIDGKLKKILEEDEEEKASAFVDGCIKSGKVLPKHKAYTMSGYKRAKVEGEESLKAFTDEIEDRKPHVSEGEAGKDDNEKLEDMDAKKHKAIVGTPAGLDVSKYKAAERNNAEIKAMESSLNDSIVSHMKNKNVSFHEAYETVTGFKAPQSI